MPDLWFDVDVNLPEVPVNKMPLVDSTDFKTIENSVAYNAAGMSLHWHFVTTAGDYTVTTVTPTNTGGDYDWVDQGDSGAYSIEMPASGGASANNNAEGFGWFTGKADGVLPWCGPVIGFRAAALNNLLIDDAYSTTRGLAGTALPNAAADAAGGLPISDAGGLDLDAKLANTNEVTAARMGALTDWIDGGRLDLILDARASQTSVDDVPTVAEFEARTLAAASYATASALAALALYASRTVVRGTVGTATTPSTTQFTPSALSPSGSAADQFKGRILVWDNDTTTAALRGQATDITASSAASLPLFTFTALTTAPANGDTFSIV